MSRKPYKGELDKVDELAEIISEEKQDFTDDISDPEEEFFIPVIGYKQDYYWH